MTPIMRYDYSKLDAIFNEVLAVLGPDRFSKMKIIELEQYVRGHEKAGSLPGRTQLRGAIHRFRSERWPQSAPRLRTGSGYR